MTQLGVAPWSVSGDIGGVGLSRQHFQRVDLGTITSSDCSNAGAAWHGLWQAAHTEVPLGVSVAPFGEVQVIDSGTGASIASVNYGSIPAVVSGSSTSHYAAGNGARVVWFTSTVRNRRLMHGCTFLVPLTVDAFGTDGQLGSVIQSNYLTAATTYLAAMATANLQHVVWHRPAKGVFTGGVAAGATSMTVRGTGAMLKSRRT